MGQSISSRRNNNPPVPPYDPTQAPPQNYNVPAGGLQSPLPYPQPRQGGGGQLNRQQLHQQLHQHQQYATAPLQFPDQYAGNQTRYGPTPRQPVAAPQQQPQTELQQTKTIRNQVNLKKPTLRIVFRNKEQTKIMPTFTFDASAPCSVTLFFLAKEDSSKGCKLTSRQVPGPRAYYETGLAQVFPPPGDEAAAESHTLDLTQINESDLTTITPGKDEVFPVVIRLETITEKGSQEGHSLRSLEPGSKIPSWVQSQTTYAKLVKEEDGSWEARTMKQKIWVEGISYELQEIYGIQDIYSKKDKQSSSTPVQGGKVKEDIVTQSLASEDLDGRECVICLSAVRDTAVLPCRHMCMCDSCARELQRQQVSKCPICREPIESLLHIRRPEKNKGATDKAKETSSSDNVINVA